MSRGQIFLVSASLLLAVISSAPTARGETNDTIRAQFTVDRMVDIALAWEAYASDTDSYFPAEVGPPSEYASEKDAGATALAWRDYVQVSYAELRHVLVPTYIRQLPPVDGWDKSFQFAVRMKRNQGIDYLIRSLGRDGVEQTHGVYREGSSSGDFAADIVFGGGEFKVFPRMIERANSSILPMSIPLKPGKSSAAHPR